MFKRKKEKQIIKALAEKGFSRQVIVSTINRLNDIVYMTILATNEAHEIEE